MANQFIARKGLIALADSQITGSLNISQNIVAGGTVQATFDTSTATAISGAFDSVSSSLASEKLNNTTDTLTGDLTVTGKITAQEFHTEFVSASIIYESGSTQFGNSADDTHQFTGSTYLGRTYISDQVDIANNYSINFGSSRVHSSDTSYFMGGNVGINKTDPDALLDIQYKDGTHNLYRASDSTGQYRWRVDQLFNQYHTNAAGTDIIAFTNSGSYFNVGNVGIGTTSPQSKLHVNGTFRSTGIQDAADALAIFINGNEEVGIGTTSPTSPLHVVGTIYTNTGNFKIDSGYEVTWGNGNTSILGNTATGYLDFRTSNGTKMYIDSSGNVGIGTTSPDANLQVNKAGGLAYRAYYGSGNNRSLDINIDGANGDAQLTWNTTYNSGDKYFVSNYASKITSGDGLIFHVAPLGTAGDSISYTSAMSIKSSGNVGIGTTSPAEKLHVNGNIRLFSAGYPYIDMGVATDNYFRLINDNPNDTFLIQKNGSTLVTFTAGGNVGINSTSPISKLHVQGTGTYNWNPSSESIPSEATIISSEMTDSDYHSILQLVSVRQSLTTGNAANGFLGFSTVDDSNGQGIRDAGRIAIVNESGNARNSATALSFWTNPGGVTSTVAPTEKMRIDSSGNVGIGTTSPAEKLHVRDPGTNSDVYIKMGNDSRDWFMGIEGSNSDIYTIKTHDSSNVFNIDSGGKVGLRVAGPHGDLQFPTSTNTRKIVLFEGADNDYQFYGFGVENSTLVYSTYTSNDDHVFFSGASSSTRNELLRVKGNGGITFNGDTAAANALDDYEEGNYTPVVYTTSGTPTYQYQEGYYTKIGRQVFGGGIIGITNSASLGGNIRISLPFTSRASTYGTAGVTFADGAGFTWPITTSPNSSLVYTLYAVIYQNSPTVNMVTPTPAAGYIDYTSSGVSNAWYVRFSFNYGV